MSALAVLEAILQSGASLRTSIDGDEARFTFSPRKTRTQLDQHNGRFLLRLWFKHPPSVRRTFYVYFRIQTGILPFNFGKKRVVFCLPRTYSLDDSHIRVNVQMLVLTYERMNVIVLHA